MHWLGPYILTKLSLKAVPTLLNLDGQNLNQQISIKTLRYIV